MSLPSSLAIYVQHACTRLRHTILEQIPGMITRAFESQRQVNELTSERLDALDERLWNQEDDTMRVDTRQEETTQEHEERFAGIESALASHILRQNHMCQQVATTLLEFTQSTMAMERKLSETEKLLGSANGQIASLKRKMKQTAEPSRRSSRVAKKQSPFVC
jgi:predicted XRE-type DNA-binding protein